VDLIDVLRRQASRFQCPNCGRSLANCEIVVLNTTDKESLVKITCAHCHDARLIAVSFSSETVAEPKLIDALDEPVDDERPVLTSDDVLDARLALAAHRGDLKSLLS
jgi:predicted RNA-binding Zn-ribbon protein involved in translation (DUF1610 family)